MLQTNEIYLNGNNSTVQIASAHETSEIQIFNHPKFGRIRTATLEDGTIVLCLSDIAKALGYARPADAVSSHCKKGVCVLPTPTVNQYGTTVMQPMKYGVEGCMNKLIMKSQLPDAEKFQDWVCYDVLPTIRKTGSYSIQPQHNIPQTYSDALLLAANQAKRIESLEAENHQLLLERNSYLEKIEFADSIMQARNCITIADMANILCQNKIFSKGRNGLYKILRRKGYLLNRGIRYNLPSQKSISEGLMRIAETPSHTLSGIVINKSAAITPKGQQYFIKMFRKLKGIQQYSLDF